MKKNVFIDEYEHLNVIKHQEVFLKTITDLEPSLVEFDLEGNIKEQVYPDDC